MLKSFFETLKRFSILTIIFSLVFGVLLLIYPDASIKFISLALGVAMIILGIVGVIDYFAKNHNSFTMALGIIVIIAGIIICVKYKAIISFVGLLFGIFIVASGIIDLAASIDAARVKNRSWIVTLILSLTSICFGLVVIFKAYGITTAIVRLIGVGLIIYAIMDIISFIQFKSVLGATRTAAEQMDEIVDDDAHIVSEEDE